MLDETNLLRALQRDWDYSGKDKDVAHEIYHDDAVLEFPQSGERFEGVENFREWRRELAPFGGRTRPPFLLDEPVAAARAGIGHRERHRA